MVNKHLAFNLQRARLISSVRACAPSRGLVHERHETTEDHAMAVDETHRIASPPDQRSIEERGDI